MWYDKERNNVFELFEFDCIAKNGGAKTSCRIGRAENKKAVRLFLGYGYDLSPNLIIQVHGLP